METTRKRSRILFSLMVAMTAAMYYFEGSLLKVVLYLYSSLYFTLNVGFATIYIRAIFFRLRCIVASLKSITRRLTRKKFIRVGVFHRDTNVICTLAEIYQNLVELCDEVNISIGFTLMLGFGIIFFFTLFTSFTLYTDVVNEGVLTLGSYSSVIFCLFFILVLITVIHTCGQIAITVMLLIKKLLI